MAVVGELHIWSTGGAFAAVLGDGRVVTWGEAENGGDSMAVQEQLRDVQHIYSTWTAFAAVLGDGRVVTWGEAGCGGDSGAVQEQLRDVRHISSTERAFAAVLGDGRVVTWGEPGRGGDSRLCRSSCEMCSTSLQHRGPSQLCVVTVAS